MVQATVDITAEVRELAERVRNLEIESDKRTNAAAALAADLHHYYVSSLEGRPGIARIVVDPLDAAEYRVLTFLLGESPEDEEAAYRAEFEFRRARPGSPVDFLTVRFAERDRPGLIGPEAVTLYERK